MFNKIWYFIKYIFTGDCPRCGSNKIISICDTDLDDDFEIYSCQNCNWFKKYKKI